MCGRYPQSRRTRQYKEPFGLLQPMPTIVQMDETEAPTWNLAPSQASWVFQPKKGDLWLDRLYWGFHGRDNAPVINARVEGAAQNAMFEFSWNFHRCAVPADGWFEWTADDTREPHYFTRTDGHPVYLAGLVRTDRFALLTGPAAAEFRSVHHRQPIPLDAGAVVEWLTSSDHGWPSDRLLSIATPGSAFRFYPVDFAVNSARNDGAHLIQPVPPVPRQPEFPAL